MATRTKTSEEINEIVNVYFKRIAKNEPVNWDEFDQILQQCLQYSMEHQTPLNQFIDRHEDVLTHFKRRSERREFPALRFIIYLNFATVIQLDGPTIDTLLRYGADFLYPKLQWPDKLQLLDTCNRANVPYKQKVFNKIAIDVMLTDYNTLALEMNLEGIIQMIAHIKTIQQTETQSHSGRVELW